MEKTRTLILLFVLAIVSNAFAQELSDEDLGIPAGVIEFNNSFNFHVETDSDGNISVSEIEDFSKFFQLTSPEEYRSQSRACNIDVSDQQLMSLFGSLDRFNCETFRQQEKEEDYCRCIDTVLKPENYADKQNTFRKAVYDTYLDLRIQNETESTLQNLESVLNLDFAYNGRPDADERYKSCFSERYSEIHLENDQIDPTLQRILNSENAVLNGSTFSTEGHVELAKQNDITFIQEVMKLFEPEIIGLQNTHLNMYSNNGIETELSPNLTEQSKKETWDLSKNQFYNQFNENFRRVLIENRDRLEDIPTFNNSNFKNIKALINLDNATDTDINNAIRPLSNTIGALITDSNFFDQRARSRDVNLSDDVRVNSRKIKNALSNGHIITDHQCRGFADHMKATFLRSLFEGEENHEKLVTEFEQEINDNDPATQARLMSHIERQLLLDGSSNFLSSIGIDPSNSDLSNNRQAYENRDQAVLSLKYTIGKMRCEMANNQEGATIEEVDARLTTLSQSDPEIVADVATLTSEYLGNRQFISAQIEMGTQLNTNLISAKANLMAYADAMLEPSPGFTKYDQYEINYLKRNYNIGDPNLIQLIAEVENLNTRVATQDSRIRNYQIRNDEIREELSQKIGGRFANGLLASRTSPNFNEFSEIYSQFHAHGMTRTDLRVVTDAAMRMGYQQIQGALGSHDIRVPESIVTIPRLPIKPLPTTDLQDLALRQILIDRLPSFHVQDSLASSPHAETFQEAEEEAGVNAHDTAAQARKRFYDENKATNLEAVAIVNESDALENHLAEVREIAGISDEQVYGNQSRNIRGFDREVDYEIYRNRPLIDIASSRNELRSQHKNIQRSLSQMKEVIQSEPIVTTPDPQEREIQEAQPTRAIRPLEEPRTPRETTVGRTDRVDRAIPQPLESLQQREKTLRNNVNRYVKEQDTAAPTPKIKPLPPTPKESEFDSMIEKVRGEIAEQRETLKETKKQLAIGKEEERLESTEETEEVEVTEIVNSREDEVISKASPKNTAITKAPTANVAAAFAANTVRQYNFERSDRYESAPITLPRRLSDSELDIINRNPASTTEVIAPSEVFLEEAMVLELVQTPNDVSADSFMDIQVSQTLPQEIDPEKPLIVRRGNKHVIVKPIMENNRIVRFEFLGEVEAQDVSQYVQEEVDAIETDYKRLIKHDDLKDLIQTSSK